MAHLTGTAWVVEDDGSTSPILKVVPEGGMLNTTTSLNASQIRSLPSTEKIALVPAVQGKIIVPYMLITRAKIPAAPTGITLGATWNVVYDNNPTADCINTSMFISQPNTFPWLYDSNQPVIDIVTMLQVYFATDVATFKKDGSCNDTGVGQDLILLLDPNQSDSVNYTGGSNDNLVKFITYYQLYEPLPAFD